MTCRSMEHLFALACLGAVVLGCTGPARSARSHEGRSSDETTATPPSSEPAARDGEELEPMPTASSDDEPDPTTDEDAESQACRDARRALDDFVEQLPAECQTDADCMTSHVLTGCRGLTAHRRSAFTAPRLARLGELRQEIRATCPEPRVVCGPAPFDPGACEAGTCRVTRTYD